MGQLWKQEVLTRLRSRLRLDRDSIASKGMYSTIFHVLCMCKQTTLFVSPRFGTAPGHIQMLKILIHFEPINKAFCCLTRSARHSIGKVQLASLPNGLRGHDT